MYSLFRVTEYLSGVFAAVVVSDGSWDEPSIAIRLEDMGKVSQPSSVVSRMLIVDVSPSVAEKNTYALNMGSNR